MATYEDKHADGTQGNIITLENGVDTSTNAESFDLDGADMAKVGKKQQLRRNFGFFSVIGLSCAIMITWEGMLIVFVSGLQNGGPAGLVYGFLWCWSGYFAVVASMGELASMMPTSGGQYHWTYVLAPRSMARFLSYMIGWFEVIAWLASIASVSFLAGTTIQGLLVLNYPTYDYQRWHGTLLMYAIIFFAFTTNVCIGKIIPKLETLVLIVHICGFFLVLIPVVVLAPVKTSAKDVFTSFLNTGGFSTQTLSFFVGSITTVFALLGADGAVHMSEEIKNASVVVPKSLIWAMLINGFLGFAMLLAILFCIGDVAAALSTPTGYPSIEIFTQALSSTAGATAIESLIIFVTCIGTLTILTSASRVMWAFSRDYGLPFSTFLSRVNQRTKLPLNTVYVCTGLALLQGLINIGSTTAFNAFLSLVVVSAMLTYIIPTVLHLHLRIFQPRTISMAPGVSDLNLESVLTSGQLFGQQ